MVKKNEKQLAIELRRDGFSYSEIMEYFEEQGMKVSKGCLSNWLRDVEMTPNAKKKLDDRISTKLTNNLEKARQARESKQNSKRETLSTGGFYL